MANRQPPQPIFPSPMQGETRRTDNHGKTLRHVHALLTLTWLAMVPIALATGWISSLIFISACSIYANAASHASAWQASKAEEEAAQ